MIDIGIQHADQTGQGIVIAAKETAALIVEYLEKQKLKSSAPKPKNPVTGNYYFNKCFMIHRTSETDNFKVVDKQKWSSLNKTAKRTSASQTSENKFGYRF